MTNDEHIVDLLPAYALGCLDDQESQQAAAHLADCPACRAQLLSYQSCVDSLALAVADKQPPTRVKQRLMASIQLPVPATQRRTAGPARSEGSAEVQTIWQSLSRLFRPRAAAWGLVSLVLILALAGTNLWWWQRGNPRDRMTTPGGMQIVALAGTETQPHATGTLVISDDGRYGSLVVDGLPVLPEGQQYQLWLIRDGQRTSGGLFSADSHGYGVLWISAPEPLASYPSFGVTIEPEGGSPAPTGERVLGGNL